MEDLPLTGKGQIKVPKSIRNGLGVKAGERITFTGMPDGAVILRAKTRNINDLTAILFEEGRAPVPIEKLSLP